MAKCPLIRKIYDESSCASSWAVGAVSAMSDRLCIKSYRQKYPVIVELSARDLMACCEQCGFGCVGGWIGDAWDYWRDHGIVSGGGFGTQKTCLPYPFPPCNHNPYEATKWENCSAHHYATPKCERQCNSTSGLKYDTDLKKGLKSYNVYPDAVVIQKEIRLHGPVEAVLSVYADSAQLQIRCISTSWWGVVGVTGGAYSWLGRRRRDSLLDSGELMERGLGK
ncbi:hypothetical protein AHF37_11017 [Paragonimus kellicotti]|nr:hypothetical protein AHF37_11017 [Paragonimus kellicotti]